MQPGAAERDEQCGIGRQTTKGQGQCGCGLSEEERQ